MNFERGDIIIYENKKYIISFDENRLVLEDMTEKGTIYYLDIILDLWNKNNIKVIKKR